MKNRKLHLLNKKNGTIKYRFINKMYPKGNHGAWPAIIFAIIMLVILVGIAFTNYVDVKKKAWSFFLALMIAIIGFGIIYWFCSVKMHAIAWFILLIPLGVYIIWTISYWIAKTTVSEDYIIGEEKF